MIKDNYKQFVQVIRTVFHVSRIFKIVYGQLIVVQMAIKFKIINNHGINIIKFVRMILNNYVAYQANNL